MLAIFALVLAVAPVAEAVFAAVFVLSEAISSVFCKITPSWSASRVISPAIAVWMRAFTSASVWWPEDAMELLTRFCTAVVCVGIQTGGGKNSGINNLPHPRLGDSINGGCVLDINLLPALRDNNAGIGVAVR